MLDLSSIIAVHWYIYCCTLLDIKWCSCFYESYQQQVKKGEVPCEAVFDWPYYLNGFQENLETISI